MRDFQLYDRVEETTTTVGTGAFALLGATPCCQSFAVVGDGFQTYYFAVDPIANIWECGEGTYHLSGHTLSRDRILSSSSSGSVISFGAGKKYVYIDLPAEVTQSPQVTSVFGRTAAVVAASGDYDVSEVTGAAPLASPALTGAPTAPTATAGDNTTLLATTAFVATAIAPLATTAFVATAIAPLATTAFVAAAIAPLATDSLVAHLAGVETITGGKVFSADQAFTGQVGVGAGANPPQRALHVSVSNAGQLTALALENTNTTDGNGTVISYRTTTTGTGASAFNSYASIQGQCTTHDNATLAGKLAFYTASAGTESLRWVIDSTGSLLAGSDNTWDIGASGATRPRNLYLGGVMLAGDGTAAACSIGFGSRAANFGFFKSHNVGIGINLAGSFASFDFDGSTNYGVNSALVIEGGSALGWSSSNNAAGGTADTFLVRTGAGVMSLRYKTNPMGYRVYNTFTDASNGEWVSLGWASNVCTLKTAANGTGTLCGLAIGGAPTDLVALHGATPVVQRSGSAQAAVATTASTQTAPYGYSTQAQADAIVTLINELRAALVEKGIIKGSA